MAWYPVIFNNGGGGGGNYTDTAWDGSLVPNTFIDRNTGRELQYTGWSATDYIDISGLTTVYRCGKIASADYNAFYDSNKNYISTFYTTENNGGNPIPANAKYVRFSQADMYMVGKIITAV